MDSVSEEAFLDIDAALDFAGAFALAGALRCRVLLDIGDVVVIMEWPSSIV